MSDKLRKAKTPSASELQMIHLWRNIKQRCLNQASEKYEKYGGRGIKICERWMSFENFIADVGMKPDGLSLGRIDNNGNYEPSNCRWETPRQQSGNTRRNRIITFGNQSAVISEWARRFGLFRQTLRTRLSKGWPIEKALTLKPMKTGRAAAKQTKNT